MIVVSVSEHDEYRFEFEIQYFCADKVGFVTRVDDDALERVWVVVEIAVFGHLTDI